MRPAIDVLHDRPIILDDDIDDLALTIRKGLAPPLVVALVRLGAGLELIARDILEPTICGDDRDTSTGISLIPGLVKDPNDPLGFKHGVSFLGLS